jgi:hypothetical protein
MVWAVRRIMQAMNSKQVFKPPTVVLLGLEGAASPAKVGRVSLRAEADPVHLVVLGQQPPALDVELQPAGQRAGVEWSGREAVAGAAAAV